MESSLLLTVPEVCMALNLGRSHVYSLIQRGDLESIRLGRSRRIPRSSLEAFVESRIAEEAGRSEVST